ncbi:hypothetical protein TCAL_14257 [Tigriopus californicus]|uniref:Uncharacterized protein n=1 Tax=Tigriopus californicus TaxID=6832 RepID=A0A553NTU9_TIGCA|nr:hypothetical protein TCAL_14257 [Tigriopus californicus]
MATPDSGAGESFPVDARLFHHGPAVNHDEDLDNRMTNLNVNAMEFVPTFLPVAPTVSAGGTASARPRSNTGKTWWT